MTDAPGGRPGPSAPDLIARLERVRSSRLLVRARIIVGSATFFDAFDALSLAFVLPVLVVRWKLSPAQVGWLIAAGYLGQLAGALVFGKLAERFGRIRAAAGATALMSVMSLACAGAGSLSWLIALRFVHKAAAGSSCSTS
jgi:putative MFS transporter